MSKTLFIRADGNESIGAGHIMRSMTIANVFRKSGYHCIYISSAPVKKELFKKNGYDVIEIASPYNMKTPEEAYEISELLRNYESDYILVDSFNINNEYLQILKQSANLICINSTRERLITDYLINENIACDREYLEKLYLGTGTKLLLGAEYSPVRDEFVNRLYKVGREVKRVLVTTGGGDQYDFMTEFLKRIKNNMLYDGIMFTVISGGYNIHYDNLMKESENRANIKIISNPENMSDLMIESDVAVSAGGTTVLELSVIGVPTIGISVAEDQKPGLSFMEKNGMIQYAGHITDSCFWDSFFECFNNSIRDYEMRKRLSESCKSYFDGRGAERVFLQITGGN